MVARSPEAADGAAQNLGKGRSVDLDGNNDCTGGVSQLSDVSGSWLALLYNGKTVSISGWQPRK